MELAIIREVCTGERCECVVRTRLYDSSLVILDKLWEAALADFPSLSRKKVKVVCYSKGDNPQGTFGLEFEALSDVPETYIAISKLASHH